MKIADVKEWIEAERALWHAVVRKEYGLTTYFHTACGRVEIDGLIRSKPRKICSRCRSALAKLQA